MQPRSQGLLRFQNGGWARRRPFNTLTKYFTNRGVFCHVTHDRSSSLHLTNGSRIKYHIWSWWSSVAKTSACPMVFLLCAQPPSWKRSRPWERGCQWCDPVSLETWLRRVPRLNSYRTISHFGILTWKRGHILLHVCFYEHCKMRLSKFGWIYKHVRPSCYVTFNMYMLTNCWQLSIRNN